MVMIGVKRGLFSNEAGEGSAPNVVATATVTHPVKQGFIQALGVFTDTLLVCSCTAFIILISGLYEVPELNGIMLTQAALVRTSIKSLHIHGGEHRVPAADSTYTPLGSAACLSKNFYKFLMDRLDTKAFGLKKTSRIKAFVFKFISVPAKWIRTARHYELNIYTDNKSYQTPFTFADG